jgi:hypothetical protein
MTDDILAAIDSAVEQRCTVCKRPLPADSPSAWWDTEECQWLWQHYNGDPPKREVARLRALVDTAPTTPRRQALRHAYRHLRDIGFDVGEAFRRIMAGMIGDDDTDAAGHPARGGYHNPGPSPLQAAAADYSVDRASTYARIRELRGDTDDMAARIATHGRRSDPATASVHGTADDHDRAARQLEAIDRLAEAAIADAAATPVVYDAADAHVGPVDLVRVYGVVTPGEGTVEIDIDTSPEGGVVSFALDQITPANLAAAYGGGEPVTTGDATGDFDAGVDSDGTAWVDIAGHRIPVAIADAMPPELIAFFADMGLRLAVDMTPLRETLREHRGVTTEGGPTTGLRNLEPHDPDYCDRDGRPHPGPCRPDPVTMAHLPEADGFDVWGDCPGLRHGLTRRLRLSGHPAAPDLDLAVRHDLSGFDRHRHLPHHTLPTSYVELVRMCDRMFDLLELEVLQTYGVDPPYHPDGDLFVGGPWHGARYRTERAWSYNVAGEEPPLSATDLTATMPDTLFMPEIHSYTRTRYVDLVGDTHTAYAHSSTHSNLTLREAMRIDRRNAARYREQRAQARAGQGE